MLGRTNLTVGLLCLTNLLSYADRTALSVLLPPIRTEFGLTDTELGVLTGIAFAAFYAIAGIPIASLADRYSRVSIVSISVAVWSLATAATGAASNFVQLFVSRMGTAIGEAGALPPSHSLMSDLFPANRRSGVLALHSAFGPIGTLLGLSLGGWLASEVGWRWTFVILGAPGVLLALLVYLCVSEPTRGEQDSDESAIGRVPLRKAIKFLFSRPSFTFLALAFAIGSLIISGLAQWLPTYFVRSFDLSLAEVGTRYGLAFGSGSFAGMVAGAAVANRLTARDLRWSMWIASVSYCVVLPLYLAALWLDEFSGVLVVIALASVLGGLGYGPAWAAIQNIAPVNMRATATAISLFGASLIGGGLGPLLVGVISDVLYSGDGAASLRYGLAIVVCVTPVAALLFWLSARYFPGDSRVVVATTPRSVPRRALE